MSRTGQDVSQNLTYRKFPKGRVDAYLNNEGVNSDH